MDRLISHIDHFLASVCLSESAPLRTASLAACLPTPTTGVAVYSALCVYRFVLHTFLRAAHLQQYTQLLKE